ncbi:MAG: hypothetical protein ACJ75Z_04325 [Solirubrobacterales bacterium]
MGFVAVVGLVVGLCLLLIPGATDRANGQSEATAQVAKKKKKANKKPVKVMTQNLYLGADLDPIIAAANAGQPGPVTGPADPNQCGFPSGAAILACTAQRAAAGDHFINEVGFALNDIQTNNFAIRGQTIAKQVRSNKPDLVALQEVALFKIQVPTDGGGPPTGAPATTPLIDFSDTLLDDINAKAMTKKQCKKKGINPKSNKCFRGYRLVTLQPEADVEQPGDFDNNPGPNGIGGNGPAFDTTPPFPCQGACSAATVKPGPPCQNGWADNPLSPGEGLNDPETNPGGDDTGVEAFDPGPPNPGTTPVSFDPVTGQLTPFDYNGDSSNNSQVNGNAGTQPLSCGPDMTAGIFGSTPPPSTGYPYASDCPDNNPINGHSEGPTDKTDTVSSCVFHGIDGDVRLQIRDAIIARKGAGVKTRNPQGGNFNHVAKLPILGGAASVTFTRGWTSVNATVRGRSFHFLDTQLEDLENGTVREDQAGELIGPGTPGAVNKTVLVGDLNSDPSIQPGPDPVNDAESSNIAFNKFTTAGFKPLTGPFNTWGHGEILNKPNDNTFTERIDWIMTNSPLITMRNSIPLNTFASGLWGSDHAGVLSVLNVPQKKGGKKK